MIDAEALASKICDLEGKRVFVRVDFNVPLKDGVIGDDTRIRASLPTINYALEQGATVVARQPSRTAEGQAEPAVQPAARRRPARGAARPPVAFADDCVGERGQARRREHGRPAGVVLLENLRFHPEEEKNDPAFAKALAVAGRSLRERRVRRRAPGACLGRGDHAPSCRGRPPAC